MIWVAEIGSNHKGVPALAHEMIRQAKWAGADIAKFQLGWDVTDRIRGMPMTTAHKLKEWCDFYEIEFMASIWTLEALDLAREVGMERYKIAKQMSEEVELVNEILKDGKPTYISSDWNFASTVKNYYQLFTVSAYPTYPSELSMPEHFEQPGYYGYSSHCHGIGDALVAVARGAKYIEKHVTLDKTESTIRDNHFALSFEEFRQMVEVGREMERFA